MIGHPQLDSDHQNIVGGKIGLLECSNFLNDSSLKHSNNPSAVVEIPCQTVKFPREDCIGFTPFNSSKHFVENFPARFLGTFAFGKGVDDRQVLRLGDCSEFGKLRHNRERLAVVVLTRFTGINEVFHIGTLAQAYLAENAACVQRNSINTRDNRFELSDKYISGADFPLEKNAAGKGMGVRGALNTVPQYTVYESGPRKIMSANAKSVSSIKREPVGWLD
ncbi:MAG: hypothetical protein M3R59_09845 [Verrucomicrobiota bacterium]|nr:hypothetical protein [Verrucomicrobiota bacterium]